jgi:hypothetical protein
LHPGILIASLVLAVLFFAFAQAQDQRMDRINALRQKSTIQPLFQEKEELQEALIEEEEEDFPHQLVVFAVGGLASGSFSPGWMPFVFGTPQTATNHARSAGMAGYESLGWLSYLYAATPEEYGCSADDVCDVPSEFQNHRSLLDVLQFEYGYAVSVFSENAERMDEALRHHYPIRGFSPATLDMMARGQMEHELPQTTRRVVLFHFDGLDMVGHSMGFERENYHAQLLCIDWQIQRLAQALLQRDPEHTTFTLISDHGGKDYEHGAFDLDVLQVPISWWGYGVCRNRRLDSVGVDTVQWAPTLFDVIGLDIPPEWNHPSLDEHVACDDDDAEALPLPSYWNQTYDGVCPVPLGFRYRSAHYADETRLASTCLIFLLTWLLGYWLFQHPEITRK